MAMWRGYGGGPYGIAIRSTFGVLDEIIHQKSKVHLRRCLYRRPILIGRVKYVDYSSEIERIPQEFNVLDHSCVKLLHISMKLK